MKTLVDEIRENDHTNDKESIVASAYKGTKMGHHNLKVWKTFIGKRHCHCIQKAVKEGYTLPPLEPGRDGGFLTSNNRYVNREEGYKIALEFGQIKPKKGKYLYSEDLR